MAATPTLTNVHLHAWGGLAAAHAAVSGRVQEALTDAGMPPLPWYETLSALADAEDDQLKMGELAELLILSRGGMTKLCDRLVKAGMVERITCSADRRAVYATLLPAGREMLDEMRPVVERELEIAFAGTLSDEEAEILIPVLSRIKGAACSMGD